ncbi:MAG: ATP-binding protein [Oscillospiraceae bacterium]
MKSDTLVLIADGNDTADKYYNTIFENSKLNFCIFAVFSEAMEYLLNNDADLLLINAESANADYKKICHEIKVISKSKDIPVMIVSSERNYDVIKDCFSAGCCDFIYKPFAEQELLFRINYHIEKSRQKHRLISENNELNLFFAAVAHDLKSPVNSLIMLVDVLKDEAAEINETNIMETAEILSNKSLKITAMIDSLMKFSRISNMIPELEAINIEMLFEDIFHELQALEPNRDIVLNMEYLPIINGDDVLIEMLIENLLTNAFKFTANREKAVIEITYKHDNFYHIISVKDNGIGFDMADSEKIFQIFKRLHESECYEGNGIGLAMCKRIITMHNGKIEANSKLNQGAEFILYFPK